MIGSGGAEEITKIALHVLETINKPCDYFFDENDSKFSDAPVILICDRDSHAIETDSLLNYRHHVVLFHHISKKKSESQSIEEEFSHYEVLADKTPKAGSILYNKEDNLSMVLGTQRDREDVKLIEYESVAGEKTENGFKLENGHVIKTRNKHFPSILGASMAILQRISVQKEDILEALKTYSEEA